MDPPLPTLADHRTEWFNTEMAKNRASYTYPKQLTLFAGTWNVNGRAPEPNADITPWLFPVQHSNSDPFDIYMLGLQEVQSLSGVDALRTDLYKGTLWRKRIHHALGSDYEPIAERQLVGILVLVFLRKNHTPYLSDVQLSYAATGFLNAVGNKGGVAARFKLYDRTIACVACHLAAHTSYVDRRNQDFTDVVRKAVFLPSEASDLSRSSSTLTSSVSRLQPPPARHSSAVSDSVGGSSNSGLPGVAVGTGAWLGSMASVAAAALSDISTGANTAVLNDPNAVKILDHDVVFWLGDLNYRIDAPIDDVLRWIKERNWDELFKADQLQLQMGSCDIFSGFREGPIRFPPTYKLDRYADDYSVDENGDMKRVPAYTDRILWRVGKNPKNDGRGKAAVSIQEYTSAPVYSSDHRPVYASFSMTFGVEDMRRRSSVEAQVRKEIDQREANMRPSLQFSSSSLDFGDIFFEKNCNRLLSIRNLGGYAGFVSVVLPKDAPKWLIFDESKWKMVKLSPNESVSLKFGVYVTGTNGTANELACRGCVLDMVIGITAEPGHLRERIHIRGRYVPTTLGLPLETLSMLAEPVIRLRGSHQKNKLDIHSLSHREAELEQRKEPGVVPFSIPKELWLLVQALMRVQDGDSDHYMYRFPQLFIRPGDEIASQEVLSFVDRGEAIPPNLNGYAIGSCILNMLARLEDSVIPRILYRKAVEAGYSEDAEIVQSIISMLPPLNANVFWYLIGFLWTTPVMKNRDGSDRELAAVFGKVLLSTNEPSSAKDEQYKTAFILIALRIHRKSKEHAHNIVFDLSHPAAHPKKLDERLLG